MTNKPEVFKSSAGMHQADTCNPLTDAVDAGELKLEALVRGSYPGRPLPNRAVPSIKTIGYWDAARDQNWGLPEHRNEGIEITYLEKGHLEFKAEGKSYSLNPEDLTITRPWQPHKVGDPKVAAGRLYWLILDVGVRQPHQKWQWPDWMVLSKKDLKDLTYILRNNEYPVWPGTPELARCFSEIGNLVSKTELNESINSRLALLINELFVCLLEMLRQQKTPIKSELTSVERTVSMFLKQLETTIEEPWTLDMMAENVGLKRSRFSHYCKKLKNMTPMPYLNYLRIERAKDIISSEPDRNLTDIAFDCGFTTSQYFSTVFKQLTGKTPRDFKKK